jgi:biotin operon repressor
VNDYSTSNKKNTSKNKEKSYNRDFIYTIPSKILHDESLTFNDVKVYMMVRSFMDTTGDAYPSNNWIANEFNMDRRTVIRSINHLIEKGYVIKEEINGVRHLRINITPLPQKVIELDEPEDNDDQNGNKSYPHPVSPVSPPRVTAVTPPSVTAVTQLDQTLITSKIIKNDFSIKSVDNFFKAPTEQQQKEELEEGRRIWMNGMKKLREILGVPEGKPIGSNGVSEKI